jgi:hypothetical protein
MMIASPLRALLLLVVGTLVSGCSGITSRPIDTGRADGGGDGDGDGGATSGTLSFEEDGVVRSGLPRVTVVVLALNQTGVQLARVTSIYDTRSASFTFEVQRVVPPVAVGTYTCGPGVSMQLVSPLEPQPFTGPASDGRCTVTFTELGTRPGERVAGSFSAVLRSASGAMKIISEGTFALSIGPAAD